MRTVGLVGTGYWSIHHLNAWAALPGARIGALCNRSQRKLDERGEQFGVPENRRYTRIEELLEQPDIEIVDIATGPETHFEFVTKAARAGKHILCQKPFASSLEEAREMVRVAEECGVRLMVTENWRWLQPNRLIKQALDEGRLGRIRVARYAHTDFYTPRMAEGISLPQPFFREMPRLLFYEMGVHWFDTWRFLFGEPERVYAEMRRMSSHIQGEDTGIVTLSHGDFLGLMDMSWATRRELDGPVGSSVQAEHKERLSIEGDLATLKLYANGRISIVDNEGIEAVLHERTELDHAASHLRLQGHFIDRLNDGKPFETSGADNLKTLELVFAAYESSVRHQSIDLKAWSEAGTARANGTSEEAGRG